MSAPAGSSASEALAAYVLHLLGSAGSPDLPGTERKRLIRAWHRRTGTVHLD